MGRSHFSHNVLRQLAFIAYKHPKPSPKNQKRVSPVQCGVRKPRFGTPRRAQAGVIQASGTPLPSAWPRSIRERGGSMALRTWMVVLCSCLFVGVGMADPSVDSSSAPSSDTECYRAELDSFVKQFEAAPQVVQSDVDEARLAIANADAESLELMYQSLSANPNWRAIPGVMVSVAAGQEE